MSIHARTIHKLLIGSLFLVFALMSQYGMAQSQTAGVNAPEIGDYLDSQTVMVVRLNSDGNGIGKLLEMIPNRTPATDSEVKILQRKWKAAFDFLEGQHLKDIFLVVSLADHQGSLLFAVVPGCKEAEAKPLTELVVNVRSDLSQLNYKGRVPAVQSRVVRGSLVIGAASVLQRLERMRSDEKLDELEILPLNTKWNFNAIVRLSPDQKRALSEMVPTLPKWLGSPDTAAMLAGVESVQLILSAEPKFEAQFLVHTLNETTSKEIPARAALLMGGLKATVSEPSKLSGLLTEISRLQPKVDGNRCRWSVAAGDGASEQLAQALAPYLNTALAESTRGTAEANLKQLMLAIHNYASASNEFPVPASSDRLYSKVSRLSWRVQLLPFLGEKELFDSFHHDEPFDSPHNQGLISQMPAVFRCPLSKYDMSDGLSNFRLPSSPETMWPSDRALIFKDITDGASNTIAIVEVDDERAVVWTKPEPFAIDLAKPHAGLGSHFPEGFFYARGDGSVGFMPNRVSDKALRAMFTRAGGERVQQSEIE